MRILALVTDCFGARGGISQYNRDFVTALAASPHVSEVVVLPRIGDAHDGHLPDKVVQFPSRQARGRYALEAFQVARRNGPFDVIFCGHINFSWLAAGLGWMIGAPVWTQVHGIDAWDRPNALVRKAFERARLITSVSRYTVARVREWAHVEPHRIRVLSNTFNVSMQESSARGEVDSRYAFAGKPFIVTLARINTEDAFKGHGRVIEVMPEVRRRHPDLQYVIIGDGTGLPGLANQAAAAGLADCVHFTGHLPKPDVEHLLAAARAFVMPSTKEGFGIVFLEAAAFGIPVIAGNVDGSVDALADGRLGLLIDPTSPPALAEAIMKAVAGDIPPPPREVLELFSTDRFRAHLHALLESAFVTGPLHERKEVGGV